MADSLGIAGELIRRSLADSTWSAYTASWSSWSHFCAIMGVPPFSSTISLATCYVSHLIQQGISAASLKKHLSGISFFLKLGGASPLTYFPLIRQMVKGVERLHVSCDRRRPITLELLSALLDVLWLVCTSYGEALVFRLAFSLAFFAALRVSELVAKNKRESSGLLARDTVMLGESLWLFLRRSKVDQMGKGTWIKLDRWLGSPVCPVEAFVTFGRHRQSASQSLLVHDDGSVVTVFQFNSVLRAALVRLGCSFLNISSHSFRIGAATEAARLGLSGEKICNIGRWRSNRYKLYVRPDFTSFYS